MEKENPNSGKGKAAAPAQGGWQGRLVDSAFSAHGAFKKLFYAHRWVQILLLALSLAFFIWALFASGTLPL